MSLFTWIVFLFLPLVSFAEGARYFYDENRIRYELVQTNGKKPYNWLFLPGGPGGDSSYLHDLIALLDLPGNVWCIDLPGSGTNVKDGEIEDYDRWFTLFPTVIERFSNPILVGHSFGGMFPLFFPQLEQRLKGFVILHSTPALWIEEGLSYAKQFNLPSYDAAIEAFSAHPSQETFQAAIDACIPYYFPPATMEEGRKIFARAAFQYKPSLWWLEKVAKLDWSKIWVPQTVPTLVIGGKYDCMCPFTLFQKDQRFHRDNVTMLLIKDGGHCSWIDNPQAIQKAFAKWVRQLSKKTLSRG